MHDDNQLTCHILIIKGRTGWNVHEKQPRKEVFR